MMNNIVGSLLISSVLPLAVLLTFVIMKFVGVDANIMALSGIAIAIGVMVDMGIILCENILRRIEEAPSDSSMFDIVHASGGRSRRRCCNILSDNDNLVLARFHIDRARR